MPRKILVTAALPYANGSIHLGHLVEHIQTDIWVRYQKMRGNECYFVCADDTHGTPIMLRAASEGITPEALIERIYAEHVRDFKDFHIGFDNYYTTNSAETRHYANDIYLKLKTAGMIESRGIKQFYDPVKEMFLPDRYIRGTCPRCHAPDQYGDSCEACGAAYQPTDLENPYSQVSGVAPVLKESEHLFFKLTECQEFLKKWTRSGTLQNEAANKLDEWLHSELKDWDISRDAPYFGFEIPGSPGKYFYVWLDAPIGYMGSFKNLCDRKGIQFEEFWQNGIEEKSGIAGPNGTELYHFIGKDILYFHALFWPAGLHFAGYRAPSGVFVHGFLTVNGEKMSKSRGTFITAESYIKFLNPEYLRYYYAAKLNASMSDLDLSFSDFLARVNSDLVGKFINLASRTAGFITKRFEGKLSRQLPPLELLDTLLSAETWARIGDYYETREYGKAVREIMAFVDSANQYVNDKKPWDLAKAEGQSEELHRVCSMCINLFRVFTIYLRPILPKLASDVQDFLNLEERDMAWGETRPLVGRAIKPFKHLMTRVETKQIDGLIEDNKQTLEAAQKPVSPAKPVKVEGPEVLKEPPQVEAQKITIDEFKKIDLRIARIERAEPVEGAQKLLRLTLSLGTEARTVFAGIKEAYDPARLTGRLVVVVANLMPRKMKFGVSEGMVLAASDESGIFLLDADDGAKPGMTIS
jgi:methionyl-tRNA synthetase